MTEGKKVYFVRHGESQWNVEDKICGITDSPLTAKGHQQALDTGYTILSAGGIQNIFLLKQIDRKVPTCS